MTFSPGLQFSIHAQRPVGLARCRVHDPHPFQQCLINHGVGRMRAAKPGVKPAFDTPNTRVIVAIYQKMKLSNAYAKIVASRAKTSAIRTFGRDSTLRPLRDVTSSTRG